MRPVRQQAARGPAQAEARRVDAELKLLKDRKRAKNDQVRSCAYAMSERMTCVAMSVPLFGTTPH